MKDSAICHQNSNQGTLAEWLTRWPASPSSQGKSASSFGSVCSNHTGVATTFFAFWRLLTLCGAVVGLFFWECVVRLDFLFASGFGVYGYSWFQTTAEYRSVICIRVWSRGE
ncbi:hypothetical protein T440DRAFT_229223 [Plenodomus tracheiphilus IPT5]|uniref:Uncharacterized protein n=1 Tax=Plenodomus tracheiphilus IPT5 TaxID=1408161 RepID=A0A6A7AUF5_9PLEO|nr:hypothetical protein T440DRAFT_229223 [Plenodomus tracheiphilus IPT5]